MLTILETTCEYRKDPLGLDERRPRISWKLRSDRRNTLQISYRLQVANDPYFWSRCGTQATQPPISPSLSSMKARSCARGPDTIIVSAQGITMANAAAGAKPLSGRPE